MNKILRKESLKQKCWSNKIRINWEKERERELKLNENIL